MSESTGFMESEMEKGNNITVIDDSDYKSTRKTKINFSINYLTFQEELELLMWQNIKIYSRNLKTLLFIVLTPIILLSWLSYINVLTADYNETLIDKHPKNISVIENINLTCAQSDCLSIGIAVIVS
jgi:hypothetical protein